MEPVEPVSLTLAQQSMHLSAGVFQSQKFVVYYFAHPDRCFPARAVVLFSPIRGECRIVGHLILIEVIALVNGVIDLWATYSITDEEARG